MLRIPTSRGEVCYLYRFSSICRDLYAFYSSLQTVRGVDLISDSTQVPRATESCGKSFAGRLAQMSLDPVVKLVKTRRKSLVLNKVFLQIRLRWREKTIRNGQTKSHIASPGSGLILQMPIAVQECPQLRKPFQILRKFAFLAIPARLT
jgi:hypothetical protein